MDKTQVFLNKYNNSKLKAELLQTAPFFSTLIVKYIAAVCSKLTVTNQFIENLLKTKINFIKRDNNNPQSSSLIEDFGENLDKNNKQMKFYFFDENILTHQIPDGLTDSEITMFKIKAYINICTLIHELNHSTGIEGFYKLEQDKSFKPANIEERKRLLDEDFVYRKKSGFDVCREKRGERHISIVEDLLCEATTDVLAHKILNLPEFDDIKYVNIEGTRKHINIPYSYEPISTIILLYSYIDSDIFNTYFTNNVTAKIKSSWSEIRKISKNICLCCNKLLNVEDKNSEEFANLFENIIVEANNIIKYFYSAAQGNNITQKRKNYIINDLQNCFTSKKFWLNTFRIENTELVEKALNKLLTLEELEGVDTV